jgi:hypothetical protein
VPAAWRRIVHGYPGRTAEELVEVAQLAITKGRPGPNGWPLAEHIDYSHCRGTDVLAQHTHDEGVWLGGVETLDALPEGVTAIVSLCLLGSQQVPKGVEHIPFRLIDRPEAAENPNLEFVIADAARTVAGLRADGHGVLIHCVAAQSRTPTVGIAYAMISGADIDTVTKGVCSVLPNARPNRGFGTILRGLTT